MATRVGPNSLNKFILAICCRVLWAQFWRRMQWLVPPVFLLQNVVSLAKILGGNWNGHVNDLSIDVSARFHQATAIVGRSVLKDLLSLRTPSSWTLSPRIGSE